MSECKHCGGIDSWHHDLTECVGRLEAALAEQTQRAEEWASIARERIPWRERDEKRIAELEAQVKSLEDHSDDLVGLYEARIAELEAERDEWRTSASMACEDPSPHCGCAGCRFAEQLHAEELPQHPQDGDKEET